MFLLSAAPEGILWPLYINVPAKMGVSVTVATGSSQPSVSLTPVWELSAAELK